MKKILPFAFAALLSANAFATNSVKLSDDASNEAITRGLGTIEKQLGDFQNTSQALADASVSFCETGQGDVTEALKSTYQSWVAIEMYHFGPIEQQSAALAINFWPDKKGFVQKHLEQFNSLDDAAKKTPEGVRQLSVAAQGLPAMAELVEQGKCPEMIGVAANIHQHSNEIYEGWFGDDGWDKVLSSGGADNPIYLSAQESVAEMYSAVSYGLQRAHMRLAQPMGSFQTPLPSRAEAANLNLSKANIQAQLNATHALITDVFYPLIDASSQENINTAFDDARKRVDAIPGALSEAVTVPDNRIPVETAMQKIDAINLVLADELSEILDVNAGFSPADGD